jgi:hypothetical protein
VADTGSLRLAVESRRICNRVIEPLNVLILYDDYALATRFVTDHLSSFGRFSRHRIYYAPATGARPLTFDLEIFDVVAVHFTVRLAYRWHLSAAFARGLASFSGLKVLFVQDEYDSPRTVCEWIRELGIGLVFSCVPDEYRRLFYPESAVGKVDFAHTLTGYVPALTDDVATARPIADRPIFVGYRGRRLPYWYGRLAREKVEIGVAMRALCERHRVPCDIEWEESRRLHGWRWYEFLASCRTMLGTESGSNVVDHDGSLRQTIAAALASEPDLTFEDVFARYLAHHDGRVRMNQIPPKVFEAIRLRTALVLFEGEYSGVILPHVHFMPLRKDFGNAAEVLEKIRDPAYLTDMTARAHRDVVESGRYSYASFIDGVDHAVEARAKGPAQRDIIALIAALPAPAPSTSPVAASEFVGERPLLNGCLKRWWMAIPTPVRAPIRRVLKPGLEVLAGRRRPAGSRRAAGPPRRPG